MEAEITNQRARVDGLGELLKARAASRPSNAYSRKWPALRTRKCINTRVASEAFGNSHFNRGPMTDEVFEAEKLAEEANEIKANQAISGRYLLTAPGYEMRSSIDSIER